MYDHINRFAYSDDPEIVASLEPILGGPGWRERLDTNLTRGLAVEKLFRETLKEVGGFDYVVSTKIDRATAERPHFFIAYGTKNPVGLKTFRQIEYDALRGHARYRADAKERNREEKSRSADLFAGHEAQMREAGVDHLVQQQKAMGRDNLVTILADHGPLHFRRVVDLLMEAYMLRETNIKDICVELAREGKLQNTWRGRSRKPQDDNIVRLHTNS